METFKIIVGEEDRLGRWLCRKLDCDYIPHRSRYVGLEAGGELVAVTAYEDYRVNSIVMHVAAIENKRWLNRHYLRFCFYYPFCQLKVNKVIGLVDSSNLQALKFDLNLGFTEEARIKSAAINGDDIIILTMTKEQCRFI